MAGLIGIYHIWFSEDDEEDCEAGDYYTKDQAVACWVRRAGNEWAFFFVFILHYTQNFDYTQNFLRENFRIFNSKTIFVGFLEVCSVK